MLYPLVFKGPSAFTHARLLSLLKMNILILITSSLVNKFVRKAWFTKHPVLWAFMALEYTSIFGLGLINVLNELAKVHPGNQKVMIFCIFIEMHFTLGPTMLEAWIF